ncbi:MAG TPA: hypothetical protein VHG08_12830 [Longimicrobium sp.]|nr:hypothetical protein [Longimicrobium sp.]
MPRTQLEREVRFLKLYAAVSSFCLLLLCLSAFQQSPAEKQRFTEIDVERINVIEKDGSLRMVLSNRERSPGPVYRGRPFAYQGGSRPGMIFYNDEGTENGGLIFSGRRNPDGTYEATHSLTFDQYEQDQIIALQYIDNNGERRQGLQILDRGERPIHEMVERWDALQAMPAGPAKDSAGAAFQRDFPVAQRVYVGRGRNRTAALTLGDPQGRTRLRLAVDSLGVARLEFLDATGRVTYSLPDSARAAPW